MPKENKLTVGNRNNSKAFLDDLATSVNVPSAIKVVKKNDGIMNEGQETLRDICQYWTRGLLSNVQSQVEKLSK